MADIKFLVSVDTKTGQASLKEFEGAIDGVGQAAGKSEPHIKSMWAQMALGQAVYGLVLKAGSEVKNLFVDSVKAQIDQENADRNLRASLEQSGRTVEGNYQHYLEFATAQQKVTKYRDEEIEKAQALLLQLTKLDQEGTDKATKGAMGLASTLGIDLQTAAMMVGRAINNDADSVARLKLHVDESLPPHEKQAAIIAEIEKLYGRATSEIDTFGGRMGQAVKAIEEGKEAFGKIIITGLEPFARLVGQAAKGLLDLIEANDKLEEKTKTNADRQAEFATRLMFAAYQAGMTADQYGDLVFKAREYGDAVQTDIDNMRRQGLSEAAILEVLDKHGTAYSVNAVKLAQYIKQSEYGAKVQEILANTARPIPPAINQTGKAAGDADIAFHALWQSVHNAHHEISDFGTAIPKLDKEEDIIEESTDEWGDSILALGDDYKGVSPVILGILDGIREGEDKAREAADRAAEAARRHKEDVIDGFLADLSAASSFFDALGELSRASAESEQADLDATYEYRKQIIADSTKSEEEKAKELEQLDKDYATAKKSIQREAAIAQKNAAYVSAVINVAEAVTKALTGAIPPFNFILAGLAAAAGAVQLATIAAQPIPLARGAILNRPTFSAGGRFEAGEAGPEAIIPLHELPAVMKSLGYGGRGGNQPIVLQANIYLGTRLIKREIVSTVQDASETGGIQLRGRSIRRGRT